MRCRTALIRTFIAVMILCAAPRARGSDNPAAPADAAPASTALDSVLAAPSLDLALLERAVLERNPSLGSMRSAWRAAVAAGDQAGALEDPMVDFATAPRSYGSDVVDPAYMVSLRQRFPIFGQRGLRGRSAKAMARAIGEDYQTARLDLLREVRRAFAEFYLNSRALGVNTELKDLVGQLRRTALAKYKAGTVGLADVSQAEVELAMLDHEQVALERELQVVLAELNALVRRDPSAPLPTPGADLPMPRLPMRADSALALARSLRPEIRGVGAEREARQAEVALADRQYLPEFEFGARYDRFMEEQEWRPQVEVGLNLPIQFGRIGAARREARAKLEETEWKRAAILTRVEADAAAAAARVSGTRHELEIVERRVVPSTEQALEATRAAYEANRGDFIALLNAERDLARARLTRFETQIRYFNALADLDRAIGASVHADTEGVER